VKWWRRRPAAHEPAESKAEAEARFRRENPVEQVCAALLDDDHMVRRAAARKLNRLGAPDAVRPLLDALGKQPRVSSGHSAGGDIIGALVQIGGPEIESHLCALLTTEQYWEDRLIGTGDNPDVVPALDWLAPALVGLGGPDLLLRRLLDLLTDERPRMRAYAAHELSDIAYRATVGYGITLSGAGRLTDEHRAAMYGPFHAALTDTWKQVRRHAVTALGHLGDTAAVDGVIARLDDDEGTVRYAAAVALGNLGDVRAIEPLRGHARDEYAAMPVRAALARLTRR
jgi:HEAT repeat protein